MSFSKVSNNNLYREGLHLLERDTILQDTMTNLRPSWLALYSDFVKSRYPNVIRIDVHASSFYVLIYRLLVSFSV